MNMLKETYINDSDNALVMPSNRGNRYDVIKVVDEYLGDWKEKSRLAEEKRKHGMNFTSQAKPYSWRWINITGNKYLGLR